MFRTTLIVFLVALCSFSVSAQTDPNYRPSSASVYTEKPDDPGAVFFTKEQFPDIHGDGVGDDSDILQQAVSSTRGGILFIPEGTYRISKTIIVGGGTRLIGYGEKRPKIVLAANSSSFQWGTGKYMNLLQERF